MRVVCENCGASYKIPESKLVKEVNKATCRKCGFRMMIRRPTTVSATPPEQSDPTEAATQVTANPLERQDAERQLLDAATRIEKAPVTEWAEDSPTNVQADPTSPPPPTAIPRQQPVMGPTGGASPDMTIALVGTFASAAGAMLLATNTSGVAAQRIGGLSIALWGALTCLFLLVTGNLWRQKGNIPISVALATVLSLGGTGFVEFALHSSPANPIAEVETPAPAAPTEVVEVKEEAEPEPEPQVEEEPVAEAAPVEEAIVPPVVPTPSPAPPAPEEPEELEALDEPDFDDIIAPPVNTEAEERRRREMEAAAAAAAEERRQREEAAAAQRRAAEEQAQREAAASAAAPEPERMRSLPLTVVNTLINSNMSIKRCFFQEEQRTGEVPSRINVRFTVLNSGTVSSARVITDTYKGGQLDSCLGRSFRSINFPAFDGESLTMNYPFVF